MQILNLLSLVLWLTLSTQAFAWDCKLSPYSTGSSYIVPLCGDGEPMKLREARVVSNSSSSTYIPASWNFRALSKKEQKTKWLREYMEFMLTQNKAGPVPKPEYEGCRISFKTTYNQGILNTGIAKSANLEMYACRVDQDNYLQAKVPSNAIDRILFRNQQSLAQMQKQNSSIPIAQLLNTKAPLNELNFDPFKDENKVATSNVKTTSEVKILLPIPIHTQPAPQPATTHTEFKTYIDADGIDTFKGEGH